MTPLVLARSTPYAEFKTSSGQNNHFLITILVGLDAVKDGSATKKPEFSTVWEPKNIKQSAARSREYAIKTSLTWITELINVYRRRAGDLPGVCSGEDRRRIQGGKDDGASIRLQRFALHLGIESELSLDITRLAIHWRNKVVHTNSSGDLEGDVRGRLRKGKDDIADQFSGMDVDRLLAGERQGRAPTFKEIASMMHATHLIAAQMDAAVIERVEHSHIAEAAIREHLAAGGHNEWNLRTQATWAGNEDRAMRRLSSILSSKGFRKASPQDANVLPDTFLSGLAQYSLEQARRQFPHGESKPVVLAD